jgi:hypothetical protein
MESAGTGGGDPSGAGAFCVRRGVGSEPLDRQGFARRRMSTGELLKLNENGLRVGDDEMLQTLSSRPSLAHEVRRSGVCISSACASIAPLRP